MEILYTGIDYPHKKGAFSSRGIFDFYGIFYFTTPFLYERDGELVYGNSGDMLISKPGDIVYHGPISSNDFFVNDWMYIRGDLATLLKKYPIPTGVCLPVSNRRFVQQAIKNINNEQLFKYEGYEEKIDCIIIELIIEIYRIYMLCKKESTTMMIEQVRNKMMYSPEKSWTLKEMASLAGISPSRFSTLYTDIYGISPKAELINLRIETAFQMLRYSSMSVGEIAQHCGFESIYYFSKFFRKKAGISPTEFRRQKL